MCDVFETDAYSLDALGRLAPRALGPLLLQVVRIPSLADDAGGGVVREVQAELGQLQVLQTVRLARHSGLGSINQDLQQGNSKHD